ncbi:MAG: OB-fold nucleic acid binding domain-containing protein [Nanoarchaeota archaeon]|nr:OB-fold nucleic acid binding domain-containing protein [Nanoarchaeota archaeon]MBU0977268.1 OB-fold nucleic acid binding domain-containing protein [Nanoarchaeota archaeon]
MNTQLPTTQEVLKRKVAYKVRIGQINEAKQNLENERLRNIEVNGKEVVRVNLIANVVDKFLQEGEKKFASLTLDDASGQIKIKLFGDDVAKIEPFNQGDTLLVIGLIRVWNNELYITPEILKKKDPSFLLVRKLEVEAEAPKTLDRGQIAELKDKILTMVKATEPEGGIDIDKIIMELKEPPATINNEIKKLLEDGLCYEPRPGKLRYLG